MGTYWGWVDIDWKLNSVHAIDIAEAHDWLVDTWDSPISEGLNTLAAWFLTSGSITSETYQPH